MIFRATVKSVRIQDLKYEEKKLAIAYCLYSWGIPFVMSTVTFIIHLIPKENLPINFITPEFILDKCWFSGERFAYSNVNN